MQESDADSTGGMFIEGMSPQILTFHSTLS